MVLPKLGEIVSSRKVFEQADFDSFAILSGDDNPIHVDPEFASTSRFGATVAHGMLLYGVICGTLSSHFPGSSQLEQRLMFVAPTYTGEDIRTRAEVVVVDVASRQVTLSVAMITDEGKVVCDGSAVLQWSEL